jgi:hypothetical protein
MHPVIALGRLGDQGGHHRWNELKPADAGTYNFTHLFDSRRTAYISQSERNVIPQGCSNIPARRCPSTEAYQESDMADDKSKRDFRDRDRVSPGDYEIEYFAQQNGVSADQVRQLIKSKGNDRAALADAERALRVRK